MAENKTKPTELSVQEFINCIEDVSKRKDSQYVLKLMEDITKVKPKMWGASMVGFGSYHYKYDSGHEGDFFRAGFSPRKQALTLYIMAGFSKYDELMAKLGKFKIGKSCLYIKKLEDVNLDILKELIISSVEYMHKRYPED
jgi:hypothetical protein